MRTLLLILVVLAAAGGIAWYLIGDSTPGGGGDPYGGDPLEDGEDDAGPGLTAAGAKRKRAPDETRGQGWIQGMVKRGGEPVGADVELRHVETIDPRNPFGSGLEMAMIGRMLDSGVSTKDVLKATTSGADGAYQFQGLAPGRYEVRATTADGAMGFAKASLPAHGARVEATIEIPVGNATLAGRVVHADGTPYRGLVVLTTNVGMEAMLLGGGGDVRPTYTDEGGRFRFGGLVPGKVSISAIVPGSMRVMGPPATVPHEGEYVLTIDAGGVEVKGRVISAANESPIAKALVFGGGGDPNTSFSIRSTTTDTDGRFSIRLPASRGAGMIVQAEGYAPQNVNLRSTPEEVTVTMLALGRIVGRVVTQENGTAVAGVTIFAGGGSNRGGMPNMSSTVTDADGWYALDNVAPGTVGVHALGAGWVSVGYSGGRAADESPYAAEVAPGETAELDLEVIPGAKAAGRVATSSGEPVVGAVVQASGEANQNSMFVALLGLGSSFGATVTDEQGRYEIDVLAPGSNYTITAQAPQHPDAVSDTFTATAGKTAAIDLEMKVPRWLTVRVLDLAGGGAVGGASVALRQGDGAPRDIRRLLAGAGGTRTDAKGLARVGPLGEGKATLSVSAPGYVARSDVEVEEMAGDAPTLTVELTRGLVIAGRVTLPVDVPVETARVTIRRDGSNGRRWFHERTPVAADGSFRVDTLEDGGSYKVQGEATWKERTFRAELEVDAGADDVALELKETERGDAGTIVFKVIDAEGKPVPSGRATLRQRMGRGSSSNSGNLSGGKVAFRHVKSEGEIWVEVYDVIGNRGAIVGGPFSPSETEIELRLPVSQILAGRAIGPDGQGVRGVRVAALAKLPDVDRANGNEHGKGVSDGDGNFQVKGLGELDYELRFSVPKEYAPVPSQAARAGARDLVVQLRAGAEATLTVLDYEGKPLAGAYAFARTEGDGQPGWRGNLELPRADRDGMIRLRGLDPDATFHLTVSAPQGRKDLKPLRREGWRPADETVKLTRAWSISGVVKDQKGKPAQGVWVRARAEGTEKFDKSSHTDDRGRFVLLELDAGRYEVMAQSGNAMHRSPAVVAGARTPQPVNKPDVKVVRAGTQDLALTVDTGETLVVRVRGMRPTQGRRPTATLRSSGKPAQTIPGQWDGKSRVTFKGLRPELSYTLWIVGIPGNAYVHATEVRVQDDVLEVDSKAGLRITGRVRVPAGVPLQGVGVGAGSREGFSANARADAKTGRFELEGLPAGRYHLNAHAWHDGKSYGGSVEAEAGGDVEIVLTAR